MRLVNGIANFGESGRDDFELDVAEHVLGFTRSCLIERIGHGERRGRASELNESDGTKLAEAARQLPDDRCLGSDAKRRHRVAAHAGECSREGLRRHEARSQDRVRERLLALTRVIEVLDLPRGQELLCNDELGELGLRADRLARL
jgi:hypothetical protein